MHVNLIDLLFIIRDNRDSMVTPGSAGGFKKGGGNGHYGFRSGFPITLLTLKKPDFDKQSTEFGESFNILAQYASSGKKASKLLLYS